jgi:alkylated DNA repair dioxygenase AlkB
MNVSEGVVSASIGYGQAFEENGYVILKQFVPRIMCDYITRNIRVLELDSSSVFVYNDEQVEKAFSAASPELTDTLLDVMTPILEQTLNCELYPTYSYLRIYCKGAELAKHQDRPSCEVSATVPLSYDAPNIWPVYVESRNNATRIELEPGDALIYKGIEVPHWREAFQGERQVQVFLHYVKKYGQYSEHRYDKRSQLSHYREAPASIQS